MKPHSLLCLGDSYTIGEALPLHESFPYQAVQQLRRRSLQFFAPEIIAQTGWTTFELAEHILHHQLNESYDFVTLLIGVNNQYRGLEKISFAEEFEFLLRKALHFARQMTANVAVFSIPDWGVTPYAKDKHPQKISQEIDEWNSIIAAMAKTHGVHFIDITTSQREDSAKEGFMAKDTLHPGAAEYQKWAILLADHITSTIG